MTEPSDTPHGMEMETPDYSAKKLCELLQRAMDSMIEPDTEHDRIGYRKTIRTMRRAAIGLERYERDLAAARAELAALMTPCQIDGCHYSELRKACDTLVASFADVKADRERLAAEHQDALVTVASFKAANDRLAAENAVFKQALEKIAVTSKGYLNASYEGQIATAALAQVKEPRG